MVSRTLDHFSAGGGVGGEPGIHGQDGLDGSWIGPVHSEETKNVLPVVFLNPNLRPTGCSRVITVIELHGSPKFRNRLHFRDLDVNMRVTPLIETYRWEAGCEKWNILIWPRLSLGLVAGCSLLVPQKVTNFLTNFTSVRFSRIAQNGIGYCLKFLERYSVLQSKIEVYLDMSPCRLVRR